MSELRQDIVSGDWVIVAPGRATRPKFLDEKKEKRRPAPMSTCPFEDLEKSGNWPPVAAYPSADKKKWRIALVPNKYPILSHDVTAHEEPLRAGIYHWKRGVGMHHLVITRDHSKNFAEIDPVTAERVFQFFQNYARAADEDPGNQYALPFCNWGRTAGASVWHPHYQVLTLPAIPPHVMRSLAGARRYFDKHHRCVRCEIIRTERALGTRVVAENRNAIALAPYASKLPFEVAVLPKKHSEYFRTAPKPVVRDVAALLQLLMRRMKRHLNDPDFNFFVHDAPLGKGDYRHHHWHAEIFPRLSIAAGFEFSTDMYINISTPEVAASVLRGDGFPKTTQ